MIGKLQMSNENKKMQLKANKKQNGGITLIALVVTIVVLLILAGITITMVLGEDGILSQAKQAAEKTKEAEEQQEKDLQDLVGMINDAVNGKDPENLQDAVSSGKVFSNTTGYDSAGKKIDENSEEKAVPVITIPAGFKIIEGDLNSIDNGVVISDEAGNEFVWVPCTAEQYKKHTYAELKSEETDEGKNLEDGNNHDEGWNTYTYRKYNDWVEENETANKASIGKYGGFYIARYEAGIPSNMTDVYLTSQTGDYTYEEKKNTSNYVPVSKKGVQAWNYINQTHAKGAAEKMYSGNRYVISQLIDGTAWDRTVEWIVASKKYADIEKDSTEHGNYANTSKLDITENILYALHLEKHDNNHTAKGWFSAKNYSYGKPEKIGTTDPYTGEDFGNYNNAVKVDGSERHYRQLLELSTGASEDTKLNNIYDLAGNMYEWTTETGYHNVSVPAEREDTSTQYAVLRGGAFLGTGYVDPVSIRAGHNTVSKNDVHYGFRVVLYVK